MQGVHCAEGDSVLTAIMVYNSITNEKDLSGIFVVRPFYNQYLAAE